MQAFSIQLNLEVNAATKDSWTSYYSQGVSALAKQDNAQAEDFFRKALNATSNSGNSAEREKCLLKLADTLSLRNKTGEAQEIYEKLLLTLSKKYGANSAQIAPILLDLGSIQEAAGDHTKAISYYQRALQINEKNYGPYSPNLAANLQSLGRAKYKAGFKSEAEQHFKRSLDVLTLDPALSAATEMESIKTNLSDLMKSTDNSNQDLLKDFQSKILNSNGINSSSPPPVQIKIEQNDAASGLSPKQSAWQQQRQEIAKTNRQWETDEESKVLQRGIENLDLSNKLSPAFNVINDSLFKQDHYEKGESYYQRMIATDLDSLGSAHPALANDLNGLARLYMSQKRYAEAIPLLSRAKSIYQKVYGPSALLTVNTGVALADAEFRNGNTDKSAELYKSALGAGQSAFGPNNIETARILNDLAYLYYQQGKLSESRTFYEWAIASTEGALGQSNPLLAACLKDYAAVLRGLGKTAEAADAESRAEKILAAK